MKSNLNTDQEFSEYASVRNAGKYDGHRDDVIQNIKISNQLANQYLEYKLEVIKNADTKDPETIKAIAVLMQDTRTVVL